MIWFHRWGDKTKNGINLSWSSGPSIDLVIGRRSWGIWFTYFKQAKDASPK